MSRLVLPQEQDCVAFARQLSLYLTAPLVLTWSGHIGSGKTTMIRALLQALGVNSAIKSPTFALVESYVVKEWDVHHFDLYRIHHAKELDEIGFRDYFSANTVCCIEWPEKAPDMLPSVDVQFCLQTQGVGRELSIQALSDKGKRVIACLGL